VASSLQDDETQSEDSDDETRQEESPDDSILDEESEKASEPADDVPGPSASLQPKRSAKSTATTGQKIAKTTRPTTGRNTRRQAETPDLKDDADVKPRRSARLSTTPVPETIKTNPRAARNKKQVIISDEEDEEQQVVNQTGQDDVGDVTMQPSESITSNRTAMALEDDEEDLVEMSLRPSRTKSETPSLGMAIGAAGSGSSRARDPLRPSSRQNEAVEAKPELPVEKGPRKRLVIRKMALVNFKSYRGRQEIGPFHKASLKCVWL
jgi:structural maintenance of chromosome 4